MILEFPILDANGTDVTPLLRLTGLFPAQAPLQVDMDDLPQGWDRITVFQEKSGNGTLTFIWRRVPVVTIRTQRGADEKPVTTIEFPAFQYGGDVQIQLRLQDHPSLDMTYGGVLITDLQAANWTTWVDRLLSLTIQVVRVSDTQRLFRLRPTINYTHVLASLDVPE